MYSPSSTVATAAPTAEGIHTIHTFSTLSTNCRCCAIIDIVLAPFSTVPGGTLAVVAVIVLLTRGGMLTLAVRTGPVRGASVLLHRNSHCFKVLQINGGIVIGEITYDIEGK